jgi:hypothetical protein
MLGIKTPVETAPDQWPTEIGEQMAAVHRIYPNTAADPRLVALLKLVEEQRVHPPPGPAQPASEQPM